MKIQSTKTTLIATAIFALGLFTTGLAAKNDACLKQVNDAYTKSRTACNKMKGGSGSGKQECYRNASREKDQAKKNCK